MNRENEYEIIEEHDLDDIRQRVSDLGIDVYDPRRQEAIKNRRLAATRTGKNNKANETATTYMGFKENVAGFTGKIVLLLNLFTGYLLPPVVVIGLWLVEIQRIHTGISFFNAPNAFLWVLSFVVVSTYISLLSIRSHQVSSDTSVNYSWSLGIFWNSVKYRLGIGSHWTPKQQPQSNAIDYVIRWSGRAIILVGSVGAMRDVMAKYDMPWYEGLKYILTKSDLITFFEIFGGIIITWVMLKSLHFVVRFVYKQYEQIMPESEISNFFGVDLLAMYNSPEADKAEMMYWQQVY